jgi:hypothetical protein
MIIFLPTGFWINLNYSVSFQMLMALNFENKLFKAQQIHSATHPLSTLKIVEKSFFQPIYCTVLVYFVFMSVSVQLYFVSTTNFSMTYNTSHILAYTML